MERLTIAISNKALHQQIAKPLKYAKGFGQVMVIIMLLDKCIFVPMLIFYA